MKILLTAIMGLLILGAEASAQKHLPSFTDYPVSEKFSGKVAVVKLSGSHARMYRSALRDAAAEGVNFAGHYVVATWGCGTDCREMAIIDGKTGAVYFTPSVQTIAGEMGQEEERLQFKQDSSLLIVVGSRNEKGKGKYFYDWKNNRLNLIRAIEKK